MGLGEILAGGQARVIKLFLKSYAKRKNLSGPDSKQAESPNRQ